jgi:acyl-CoA synthetase (AMP-forming)/AMP-acid ligase II
MERSAMDRPAALRRWPTLVDMCRDQVAARPDQLAYRFLADGETVAQALTLAAVDRQATAVAAQLSKVAEPGSRAVLAHPPGLDFVTAFLGCLYANVVAVPVPAPTPGRAGTGAERLRAIIGSAEPTVLMSTAAALSGLEPDTWQAR